MEQLRRTVATRRRVRPGVRAAHARAGAASAIRCSRPSDLLGGIWLPGDGTANPTDLTQALARGARQRGATVVEHVRVTEVLVDGGAVTGVRTDQGDIEAEIVVNCAGQWAHHLAAQIGVAVPLHSAEHFYVVTDQIDGVRPDLPILRDPDGYTYFKEEVGGLVVGGFEPEAKPWVAPDQIPYPFEFQLLDEDWDHFQILMDSALQRIPVLHDTGIRKFYNGPESFTPDNQFILGEAPSVRGFFVGAGFNSVGIASAGGAGRALAEWVLEGEPTVDLLGRRHPPVRAVPERQGIPAGAGHRGARPALRRAVAQPRVRHRAPAADVAGLRTPGRRQRRLRQQDGLGAGQLLRAAGASTRRSSTRGASRTGCPGRSAEQVACREAVAIFDQSSFSKYVVHGARRRGRPAVDLQQRRRGRAGPDGLHRAAQRARRLRVRPHRDPRRSTTSSSWSRSSATTERDQDWLRRNIPAGLDAQVHDVTDKLAVFGVMGPRSRELLSRLTDADLSEDGFAFGASREIELGRLHGAGHPDHVRRRARLGAVRPHARRARRSTTRSRRPAPTSAWSMPATTRSSRCASRRAIGRSAAS